MRSDHNTRAAGAALRRTAGCGALLVCAALALPATAPAQQLPVAGRAQRLSLVSADHRRDYYLLAPPSLAADGPAAAPLLILLHGSYSTPLEVMQPWRELAASAGLILVAPESSAAYGWRVRDDSPAFFRDLVDAVAQQHPIDRRRVYLFGHSAGAVEALTIGMLESQYFAAVAVHAGAFTQKSSFNVLALARRKIPLWIAVGDRDDQFPLSAVRETQAALQAAGLPLTLTILKGHDHSYTGELAERVSRDAWTFLAPLSLEDAPLYQPYR